MKRHHLKRGGYVEKKSTHFIPKAIKYGFGAALAGTATTIVGLGPLPGMAVHALFYCGEAEAIRQK